MHVVTFPIKSVAQVEYSRNIRDYTDTGSCNANFRGVILSEIRLFESLCTAFEIPNWRNDCEYLTEYSDTFESSDVDLLTEYMEERGVTSINPFRSSFMKVYKSIGEIFCYDWGNGERAVVLFNESGYYTGHIYVESEHKDYLSCIGIRSSLVNIMDRVLAPRFASFGIVNHLLMGLEKYGAMRGVKNVCLESPIGVMPMLAARYGFHNGDTLTLEGRSVPEIELTIY